MKTWYAFWHVGMTIWNNSTPYGTLARLLARWHVYWHVGTYKWEIGTFLARWHAGTLARKPHWHASMLARRPRWHVGTLGTRISKLVFNWFPFLPSVEIYFWKESLLSISTPNNFTQFSELITSLFLFRDKNISFYYFFKQK